MTELILKPHQLLPVEFMKKHRGLILYHSTGSGKTLTALFAAYQFREPIIIIGNKSSKKTFDDNIIKAKMDSGRFIFYTFTKIKKILETQITIFKNKTVIIDEAHNIRNENIHNLYLISALITANKIILLTATPVVNYMNDLSVLVNVIKGEDVLPTERKLFEQMYYDEDKMQIINESYLINRLKNTISCYKTDDLENYPTVENHYQMIEMSHDQMMEYVYYIKKVIYEDESLVENINLLNIDYSILPNKKRNFFLNVTRQLSNTIKNSTLSPKINAIFNKIIEGPFPVVVYSNYLKNGIYTLAVLLEEKGINYKTITGMTSADKLNMIVNNYNQGTYQILLISSAGSESLDLKKTRQLHIMELHWNEARNDQVKGRVIRFISHSDLPIEERHVDIYTWISVFPNNLKNMSADQYLMEISKRKTNLWNQYQDIITEASIENMT